jgi:hypothetical protein
MADVAFLVITGQLVIFTVGWAHTAYLTIQFVPWFVQVKKHLDTNFKTLGHGFWSAPARILLRNGRWEIRGGHPPRCGFVFLITGPIVVALCLLFFFYSQTRMRTFTIHEHTHACKAKPFIPIYEHLHKIALIYVDVDKVTTNVSLSLLGFNFFIVSTRAHVLLLCTVGCALRHACA